MKLMTKEELIEYFIGQLGDNEILGKIMSIEEIKKKLNDTIQDVNYFYQPDGAPAFVAPNTNGKCSINYNVRKIDCNEANATLVHEILHVLSYSDKNQLGLRTEKTGLQRISSFENISGKIGILERKNVAINEGLTDTLAEKITGESHSGYKREKDIYKIVAIIVGEETMMKKYFSEHSLDGKLATNIFKEDLVQKYGKEMGTQINNELRLVLQLSYISTNLKRKDKDEIRTDFYNRINNRIYKSLENMLVKVINNEPDIMKKINEILIPVFSTSMGYDITDRILGEVVGNKEIDYATKLEIIKAAGTFRTNTNENLHQIMTELRVFKKEFDDRYSEIDTSDVSPDEKISRYFSIYSGYKGFMSINKLYDLYIDAGEIVPGEEFKKVIFRKLFIDSENPDKEMLDKAIADTKYRKIGNYYQMVSNDGHWNMTVDSEGHFVQDLYTFQIIFDEEMQDTSKAIDQILPECVPSEKREELINRIKNIALNLNVPEQDERDLKLGALRLFGNVLEIQRQCKDGKKINAYHEIREDGTIVEIEDVEERRFSDDMSRLDIELQEQTQGVSMTEMKQEAESIKSQLQQRENPQTQIEQEQLGE